MERLSCRESSPIANPALELDALVPSSKLQQVPGEVTVSKMGTAYFWVVSLKRNLRKRIFPKKEVLRKLRELKAAKLSAEEHMKRNASTNLEVPCQVICWVEEAEEIITEVEFLRNRRMRHRRNALNIINKKMDSLMIQHSLITWSDLPIPVGPSATECMTREAVDMRYRSLRNKETEAILLLCGLFSEDSDIPIEELVRYSWGLGVFKEASTIRMGRWSVNACIRRLTDVNLLIESTSAGCVKMQNLVRDYVLDMCHLSIVNHGSAAGWPENSSSSCERISLSGDGMREFPKNLNFPNLRIMKLMQGDKSLVFPPDFYEGMGKLEVISYDEMMYPMLPSSANLRVLHLHKCSLTFDCSCIGNLSNLEVLSFAKSGINRLPSTIGNLKKLRLLDLTDCARLCVDNGVFKNLVKLEELYTIGGGGDLTEDNCNEVADISGNLLALEFDLQQNYELLKNMSFENLERFKISVGRSFDGDSYSKGRHSHENTLQLVLSKSELFSSGVYKLIEKAEVLFLDVGNTSSLEDLPRSPSFDNLRVLVVTMCHEMAYLCKLEVAKALLNLEHLQVCGCDNMKQVIQTESIGEETITFPKLKFLSLVWLRGLSDLFFNVNEIKLPELVTLELYGIPNLTSIFSSQHVCMPKLEKLIINDMEKLEEIWPAESRPRVGDKLRDIQVGGCNNLVNLLPRNPFPYLAQIEELKVKNCGSVRVLFHFDLDLAVRIEQGGCSKLRSIQVKELGKLTRVGYIEDRSIQASQSNKELVEVSPTYGYHETNSLIHAFEAVESIQASQSNKELVEVSPAYGYHETNSLIHAFEAVESIQASQSNKELVEVSPTYGYHETNSLIHAFEAVESIRIERCKSFRKLFTPDFHLGALINMTIIDCGRDIEESVDFSQGQTEENAVFPSDLIRSFSKVRKVELNRYEGMEAVFEIESPTSTRLDDYCLEVLDIKRMSNMSHVWKCNWKQVLGSEPPFHKLTTIHIDECHRIKYLFSPLMMLQLVPNLKTVQIQDCDAIEAIVSEIEDETENTNTALYPCLDSLTLSFLPILKCIGGDQSKSGGGVSWSLCEQSSEISISYCGGLSSVIPSHALGQMHKLQVLRVACCYSLKEVFERQGGINNELNLCMLRVLEIKDCHLLEHVFTFSTLKSLLNLQELTICDCNTMEVIVKEEEEDARAVVILNLKSIVLINLPNLVGFFEGMNHFTWPSLDDVIIKNCPKMSVFTSLESATPKLNAIQTSLGKHSLEGGGLNLCVAATVYCQTPSPTTWPWNFYNLFEIDVEYNTSVENIIPSGEQLQLEKLQKIYARNCDGVEEVFEAGTNSVVKLPDLKEMKLAWLNGLRTIWNKQFELPNLTRLSIGGCKRLQHVFTSPILASLLQLQDLHIYYCCSLKEVIVVEEEESNTTMLPSLKSLVLERLACLKGFCLGNADFSLPLLDTLRIEKCPVITTFIQGKLDTPKLREIGTDFGSFYAPGIDINSFINGKQEEFEKYSRFHKVS